MVYLAPWSLGVGFSCVLGFIRAGVLGFVLPKCQKRLTWRLGVLALALGWIFLGVL